MADLLSKRSSLLPSLWDPFKELEEMRRRMASLFERPLELLTSEEIEPFELSEWRPFTDITEDDKEFLVKMDLPGIKKEEVKVSIQNNILTVSGERKVEKEEKDKKKRYIRVERAYGAFSRSFELPEGVDKDKISAEFKDGVLYLHMPKGEEAQPKTVEVKVS
ncbi:Hsp20/alpha crystallin family protein [Candidatus Methylacidiphilum infernorum]|uniref:Hsp20/alpha crystallin family protein n=1 Tax=Candidatus Methylacidiphilum infernorum TaxID=511746 RepID=A0ABX7PWX2_9BACT|nr:Hsp20/alpha crystallin family protein [Candidatus Methylacidiphilum infernorum]QSR87325.1 Hsp20/alpha crystallin family protein [Candidatus Methylacidiphilum infernorum]